MDTKQAWLGTKNQGNFVTSICVLMFSLNAVLCDMFCPPAQENAGYNITVEKYNLATRNLNALRPTWYVGQDLVASCNFTTTQCQYNPSLPRLPLTFQVLIFGDDDVQMTLMIANFTADLQKNFSVQWEYGGLTTFDSCQVNIGGPIDECTTQQPCLNEAGCTDLSIGYSCACTPGFSGITCREGDLRLRCSASSYRIVFNHQVDSCADFNITCFVAGADIEDTILNYTEVSNNGSNELNIMNYSSSNVVFFKLCITSSTHFGKYQIIYNLQTPEAVSNFTLQILPELTNVNTAPEFNTPGPGAPYTFDVPENTQRGAVIIHVNKSQSQSCTGDACIQVLDPDVTASSGVDSLSLAVDLENQQQPVSIAYHNDSTPSSFGYFYVSGQLTPSTNISFNLTATDGSGSSASARVTFRVTDVNHPPVCATDTIILNVDIRWQPVRNLGSVSCSDSDSVEAFRRITYTVEGDLSEYFSVDADGVISMYQSVQSLEPGLLTFNVTATGYSALPDPAFVFSIPVQVNLTVPEPMCNLTISSTPDLWATNTSAVLQLSCDVSGVDKLRPVSWNLQDVFNASFTKLSPSVYTVTLDVIQYTPAVYIFEVLASLGDASTPASVTIAMYNRPRFYLPYYTASVTDTASVGTLVIVADAETDINNATLVFSIKSGNNASLFRVGNNGTLYLAREPLLFAGSTFHLVVEDIAVNISIFELIVDFLAKLRSVVCHCFLSDRLKYPVQDSISGLTDTADVIINITDTNQPPVCDNPGQVRINSNLAPGSVITRISCNDSDITEQFKNLSYSISTVPATVALGVRNNKEIVLLEVLPAAVTFVYVVVNVSDVNLSTLVQFNITITVIVCPKEVTEFGLVFPETPVNSVINISCPNIYSGIVSRHCNMNQTWDTFNYNSCRRKDLANATALLMHLKANASQISPEVATAAVKSVANLLAESLANDGTVLSGDIQQMVALLSDVGEVMGLYENASLGDETLKSFASSSDSIIGADVLMWQQAVIGKDEGARMLQALDSITSASVRNASFDEDPVVRQNLAIKRAVSRENIVFPDTEDGSYQNYSGWVINSNIKAFLSKGAFQSMTGSVKYSVILYKNVTEKFKVNSTLQDGVLRNKVLHSDILSFTVDAALGTLSPPLLISLPIIQANYSEPLCGYLNTSASVAGVWATQGCTPEVFSDRIQCSCNHLTNFAVLMSPFGSKISSLDETILSIISAIGCGISMFCLAITIIIYIILWRYVKCDRAVLHVNLSVCLILAYVVFLVGVDRTENEVGCKVVAALLHYLFLVVFFTMLCEGIEIFKSVTFVFTSESIIPQLLLIAYGVPVVIVAVSLGVTKTEGYGSKTTCWLSVDNGLIWAFVGPALLVILINCIVLIRVLRIMQQSQHMMVKTAKQRTKSVVRTIFVLSPLLGVTWVFGVLSVSEETVVFQYLFAIFNSLQGLFIFICYCLLTPQVRDGFKALRRKYRAKSFDSNQRVVSSSFSGKYSESESTSHNHKKNSKDFKSSSLNTHSTSVRESSQEASSYGFHESKASRSQYGRQESTASRNTHRSDSDSVFSHHTEMRYGGEIPLSYTDPHSRNNTRLFEEASISYPGTFLPGYNFQNSGQALMHRGNLFSTSDKRTESC